MLLILLLKVQVFIFFKKIKYHMRIVTSEKIQNCTKKFMGHERAIWQPHLPSC